MYTACSAGLLRHGCGWFCLINAAILSVCDRVRRSVIQRASAPPCPMGREARCHNQWNTTDSRRVPPSRGCRSELPIMPSWFPSRSPRAEALLLASLKTEKQASYWLIAAVQCSGVTPRTCIFHRTAIRSSSSTAKAAAAAARSNSSSRTPSPKLRRAVAVAKSVLTAI